MNTDDKSAPETPGGKRPAAPQHSHVERLLDSLALIVESGKARTASDLLRYATQAGLREGVVQLREMVDESVPVELALDALRVHVRIIAFKRGSRLIGELEGKKVALVLPLPPHVIAAFAHLEGLLYVLPDGHPLPPHLEELERGLVRGSRDARQVAPQQDVLVFEVVKQGEGFAVDAGVSDVVDARILPPTTRLVAHVRSQAHPDDVPLALSGRRLEIL